MKTQSWGSIVALWPSWVKWNAKINTLVAELGYWLAPASEHLIEMMNELSQGRVEPILIIGIWDPVANLAELGTAWPNSLHRDLVDNRGFIVPTQSLLDRLTPALLPE